MGILSLAHVIFVCILLVKFEIICSLLSGASSNCSAFIFLIVLHLFREIWYSAHTLCVCVCVCVCVQCWPKRKSYSLWASFMKEKISLIKATMSFVTSFIEETISLMRS
jgi:hypothetical protein